MDNALKELKVTDDGEKLEVLTAHINEEIRVKIQRNLAYDQYFDRIFKKKYKSKFSEKYESLLVTTKQTNFITITEYLNKIEEIIKRMKITDKLTDVDTKKIRKKWFFKNLHKETKLRLASEQKRSVKKVVKLISDFERIITEKHNRKEFITADLRKNFEKSKVTDKSKSRTNSTKIEKIEKRDKSVNTA